MKVIAILFFTCAFAIAHPLDDEKPTVEVIKQEIVHKADKGYHFE
jgi:hypothetical protein